MVLLKCCPEELVAEPSYTAILGSTDYTLSVKTPQSAVISLHPVEQAALSNSLMHNVLSYVECQHSIDMFMHIFMPTVELELYRTVISTCVRVVQLNLDLIDWAAWYSTCLLNKPTPKGVVFSLFSRSLRVLQKLRDLCVDKC